jgi:hypothetical protein
MNNKEIYAHVDDVYAKLAAGLAKDYTLPLDYKSDEESVQAFIRHH